ncbi:Phosphorylated adapter RNA export protein, RNA-binding domain [Sesbania bispinosa]|nr:Phosphorylated adapter RNA export protein, RNA-binding domain [Sesbania bispinosa]
MEGGENILDAIYEEDNLDDVEMMDIEEGELVEHDSQNVLGQNGAGDISGADKNPNRSDAAIDINRFVIDTCRRLKEKKSYMVYTAVGCLGVSALSDLIKEVDAIQACGGQKTADGKRFRTGGGVLWSIIKVREPNAYKEIMKKAKEFEKQFRQPGFKQPPVQKKEDSSQGVPFTFVGEHQGNVSDNPVDASPIQHQHEPSVSEEKHISVHDRLRIPVSYDDDLLGVSADKDAT